MKILPYTINIYFTGLMLTALFSGCKTSEKKDEELSTIRLHLEVNKDGTSRNTAVPIYRSNPTLVNVMADSFLDERDIKEAAVVETMGGYALMLQFDKHGTLVLDTETSSRKGSRIAIYAEFGPKRWLAAPLIKGRITDGVLTFTPDATREESERIARGLNNAARVMREKSSPMFQE